MSEKTYNGWTNYETWNVNLWMDNDGSDSHWRERAEELMRDNGNDRPGSTRALADEIKDSIEEANPVGNDASMFADLMNAALSEVDWWEIAEHYILDVEIEEPEPDEETQATTYGTCHFSSVEAAIRHFGGDVYTESATDNPKAYVAHGIAAGDIVIGRPLLRHGQTLSVINGRYHVTEGNV